MRWEDLPESKNVRDLRKASRPKDPESRVRVLAKKLARDIGGAAARSYLLEAYADDDARQGWVIDELNLHDAEPTRERLLEGNVDARLPKLPDGVEWTEESWGKERDKYLRKRAY